MNKKFEDQRIRLQNADSQQIQKEIDTRVSGYLGAPVLSTMHEQGLISEEQFYQFAKDITTILINTKTPLQTE